MSNIYISIQQEPLDIAFHATQVQSNSLGAIDIFVGTVRNSHQGKSVTGITYDAHPLIAEKSLRSICEEAQHIWKETNYALSHFVGELPVGGVSIVIAVSSPHRAESFEACRYVIEEIKKRAPIWKQEHYLDGKSAWLPGHSLNNHEMAS